MSFQTEPNGLRIIVAENKNLPDIARVPWELSCIDGDFICTDLSIPIIRQPDLTPQRKEFKVSLPLRMAFLSACPEDQNPLKLEEELVSEVQ